MNKCDLCCDEFENPVFMEKIGCGHNYCACCKYNRRDLLRNNICLVCIVDDKKMDKEQKSNSRYWEILRYGDMKINFKV